MGCLARVWAALLGGGGKVLESCPQGGVTGIFRSLAKMEAYTGNKGSRATILLTYDLARINQETVRTRVNVPTELGTSSQGEAGVSQRGNAVHQSFTSSSLAQHDTGTPGTGSNLSTLNPLAAPFTPHGQAAHIAGPTSPASDTPTVRPPSPHRSTPPSLERFARDLRALKSSSTLSSRERLARMHDQRRQLLSHMGSAKAEMEELEGRLVREESVEGSQDVLNRLKDLRGLQEWVGHKGGGWGGGGADLGGEIARPGA